MTVRGTALLVALLAVLLASLRLAENRPRAVASPAEEPPLLGGVAPDAVVRVELDGGGRRLTAARHDGTWVDERGRRWRDGAVTGLVETLATLRPIAVVDRAPRHPDAYGLGPGATRLVVTTRDGIPAVDLAIGGANPAGTGVYVRPAGRLGVLLVGGVLRWELDVLRDAAPSRSP